MAYDTGGASCGTTSDTLTTRPLQPGAVDPALMDRALRQALNAQRCARGLAPLVPDPSVARAALDHATDMAEVGFVAPTRPADPSKTLATRLRRAGADPYRRRAENLMRIALETPGVARYATGAPECDYSQRLGIVPTYRSVAGRLMAAWARTEAFSANLFSTEWTHVGGAVAIRPVEGSCGDVYAALTFVRR